MIIELSGSLNNVFDKEAVQNELDLQRTVSQSFNQNVQAANTEINKHLDDLKAKLDDPKTSAAEKAEIKDKISDWQLGQVLLNSIAAGLTAPTQSAAGIAAATASPALSYAIGQEFKKLAGESEDGQLTAGQQTAHILAHAVLGAAVAAAGNNSAIAGAISAGGAEAAAPVISNWLYNEKDGSKLTAGQKETVAAITGLLGTATGAAVGGTVADSVQGSLNAQSAVENNSLQPNKAGDYFNQLMNNPKNEKQILAQLKKESQIFTEKAKNCTSKAECVELERQLQEYHYTFNQWSQSFIKNKDKVSLEAKEFYEQQRKETLSDIQEVHKRIASFERQETNSVVLKTDNKSRTPLFEGVGEYEINGKKFRGTWGTGSMNAGLGWNPEGPDYIKVVSGRHSLTFTTHEPTNPLYGISQDMLGYAIKDGASLAESRKGKQIRDKIHKFYGDDSPKAAVYLGWFDYEDPELKTYLNKANVYEKSQSFHPKTEKMKSERQKYVDDGLPGGSFSYEVCVNYFCNSKGITSDLQKTTNEIGFSLGGKGYSFGAGGGYSWRVKELMEKVKTNDKK